jgi:NTP pyrophosphatase (non-canonical NTP hydrolase)
MAFSLAQLQQVIYDTYDRRDRSRGVEGTFVWLMEEIGELATTLRGGTQQEREEEFADVLAWLATLANIVEVDLEKAVQAKYGSGCPGCKQIPCVCDRAEKP